MIGMPRKCTVQAVAKLITACLDRNSAEERAGEEVP
jgi:hypothetical protein